MLAKQQVIPVIKIVSTETIRQIEAAADAGGISYDTMMQRAGRAVAAHVLRMLDGRGNAHITLLIGPGNNGGDGLVAGRIIAEQSSALVRFYLMRRRDENDPNYTAVQQAGLLIAYAEDDQRYRVLHHMIASADIVIDALFGIGVRLPLTGDSVKLLRAVHQALHEPAGAPDDSYQIDPVAPSPPPVRTRIVAIDCPSGLECDTGEIDAYTLPADETVTFIAAKPGLLAFPGAQIVGHLSVAPIGIPEELAELQAARHWLVDSETVRQRLPQRAANAHKGSTGRALIVAGSKNYLGAPALAALGAYRAGAGLVTVAVPESIIQTLAGNLYEPTWLPLSAPLAAADTDRICEESQKSQSLLLGPGWGQAEETAALFNSLMAQLKNNCPPLVIDADGLNLLSTMNCWWEKLPSQNVILTPHPGEMARLCQVDTATIQANRRNIALEKANEWGVILLLKGAHTLIAAPDGQLAVLPFKTDALATAGTGDILAGVIGGLLAQGLSSFNAAVVGGYLHGLAGIIAARHIGSSRSVIARDVATSLGQAFQQIENS
jgi:NAD(P)H-hydrate epimerase